MRCVSVCVCVYMASRMCALRGPDAVIVYRSHAVCVLVPEEETRNEEKKGPQRRNVPNLRWYADGPPYQVAERGRTTKPCRDSAPAWCGPVWHCPARGVWLSTSTARGRTSAVRVGRAGDPLRVRPSTTPLRQYVSWFRAREEWERERVRVRVRVRGRGRGGER
ncbi:hypothetical protein GGS23DRAFT_109387 [Durotheca rogersii]|uniref:uncharacterized protein n=1 Tax=Durotheca rogersii TaxID=419775 RepID=UPI00221EAE8C|nr:uncharacterized protein GGS23DRAFT_109387 [Durotheca rogersii]KAI5862173.1 hypothetical protein GGS23DRAFT_109387 [Durotheca rogersii]